MTKNRSYFIVVISKRVYKYIIFLLLFSLYSCVDTSKSIDPFNVDSNIYRGEGFDLEEIKESGQLIALTMYDPVCFMDYHGENDGYQYNLAENFATSIGCSLRVAVMTSEKEMLKHLIDGDGDMILYAMPVTDTLQTLISYCGEKALTPFVDSLRVVASDSVKHSLGWVVRASSESLASSLNNFFAAKKDSLFELSAPKAITTDTITETDIVKYNYRMTPLASVQDRARGVLSPYDAEFRRFAPRCGWDWRLLAAQAYQESGFDARAVSPAGAIGLMQIMPATAKGVGVSQSQLFIPSVNVCGGVRILNKLNEHYAFIRNRNERINFVLAAYNAGKGHIDDARRLATDMGKNPDIWDKNVDSAVLALMIDSMYSKPFIRAGYLRGKETYNYVNKIRQRWTEYRRIAK